MASQPMTLHRPEAKRPRAPWLWRGLGWLIRPWLGIRTEPSHPDQLLASDERPLVYLLERYGISNVLILEQACRGHGLQPPLLPMPGGYLRKWRSVLAVSRRDGIFRRPRNRTHSEGLAQLVNAVRMNPHLDIRIVPVSIFVGRAPARESGWFRVLFSENWSMVGRFRRLVGDPQRP